MITENKSLNSEKKELSRELKDNPIDRYVTNYLKENGNDSLKDHNSLKAFVEKTLNDHPKVAKKIIQNQGGAKSASLLRQKSAIPVRSGTPRGTERQRSEIGRQETY